MIVTNNPHVMTVTSNLVITAAAQLAYTMIEDMTDYAAINIPNYNTITQIPDEYKPSKINTCLATEWENAFANMQALTSFPESFYDISNAVNMANLCRGDENLITPPNLSGGTNIINLAYAYVACNNLSVTPELPPNVEDIDGMFGLTNITDMPQIPESVTNMNLTFLGCKNLVNTQNIPEGVVSLEETFAECTSLVSSPVLPQNGQLTNLFATFLGCSNLQEPPIIPNTVTDLGRTFERCSNLLNSPEIPNSVISMMNTFDNSGISSFPNIPSSVIDLNGCFSNCINLTGTLVISDDHNFSCEGIFNNSTKEKVIIFNGHGNNYNTNFNMIEAIGGERPYISDGPFNIYPIGYYSEKCNTSIKIDMGTNMYNFYPKRKFVITNHDLINTHLNANLVITDKVTNWSYAFANLSFCDEVIKYNFSNAVDCSYMFSGSGIEDLSSINLPDSVTNLSFFASECEQLTRGLSKLPNKVTDIGGLYAVSGLECNEYLYHNIPNTVVNMAAAFFVTGPINFSKKITIDIPDSIEDMTGTFARLIPSEKDSFENLPIINMKNAVSVIFIDYIFAGFPIIGDLIIGSNVIETAINAFVYNTMLGEPISRNGWLNVIVHPNTKSYNTILDSIGGWYANTEINVTLKKYMTDMSNYASINIPNYQTITEIPREHIDGLYTSEVTIWDNAFSGCKNLQTVDFTNYDFTNALSVKGICSNYNGYLPIFNNEFYNNTAFDNVISAENAFKNSMLVLDVSYNNIFLPIGKNTVTIAGIFENTVGAFPLFNSLIDLSNVSINITNSSNAYFNSVIIETGQFIPQNIVDMSGMFAYANCGRVTISEIIPPTVKNMHSSFFNTVTFQGGVLGGIYVYANNLENIVDLSSAFAYGCIRDIRFFCEYGNMLTTMNGMFQNTICLSPTAGESISLTPSFNIPSNIPENVTDITNLYRNSAVPYCLNNDCYVFANNITNATGFMSDRLDDGMKLINFYCYNGTTTYNTLKEEESRNGVGGTMGNFNFKVIGIEPPKIMTSMVNYAKLSIPNYQNVTEIPVEHLPNIVITNAVENWYGAFADMFALQSIPEPFYNTSNAKDYTDVFSNCSNLSTTPEIPYGVTNISSAFWRCANILNPPIIPNTVINMSTTFQSSGILNAPEIPYGVLDMRQTFSYCNLINAPEIPNSVTNMYGTFMYCLKMINGPTVIPNSVTDVCYLFKNCYNLITAPTLPSNITNLTNTFANCINLSTIPLIPNNVLDMTYTFISTNIANPPILPNTVVKLYKTFAYCDKLTSAPNIPINVTNISGTFMNCINIKTDVIVLSSDIVDARNCFKNSTTYHKNIYVPYDSQTYNSFYLAMGNSITNSNWNATLIPYNSTDEIPGYEDNKHSGGTTVGGN